MEGGSPLAEYFLFRVYLIKKKCGCFLGENVVWFQNEHILFYVTLNIQCDGRFGLKSGRS